MARADAAQLGMAEGVHAAAGFGQEVAVRAAQPFGDHHHAVADALATIALHPGEEFGLVEGDVPGTG